MAISAILRHPLNMAMAGIYFAGMFSAQILPQQKSAPGFYANATQ